MKKLCAMAVAAMCLAVLNPAYAKPAEVWTDNAGDAGNQDSGLPGVDQLGFDLVAGSLARNGTNIEFTVTHAAMPPTGTPPETYRFLWGFSVDGVSYRLTVKRADVGKPDVIGGQTTERVGRADVNGHFRLEGECAITATPAINLNNCIPLAYLEGTWDPAAKTFMASVPMEVIKAKPGSKIAAGDSNHTGICQICWVTQFAERSLNYTIVDSAAMGVTWKVPKK